MLTIAVWERSRCLKAFAVYCLEMGWAHFPLQPHQGFLIIWCVETVLWFFSSLLFGYIDSMCLLLSHSSCHRLSAASEWLYLHIPEASLSFLKAPTIHCFFILFYLTASAGVTVTNRTLNEGNTAISYLPTLSPLLCAEQRCLLHIVAHICILEQKPAEGLSPVVQPVIKVC